MVFDHHVHLEHGPYSPHEYTEAWVAQYFDTAVRMDVTGIGVVEHAYRFTEARGLLPGQWALDRCRYSLETYHHRIRQITDKFPVALGLEVDFVPEQVAGIATFLAQYLWDFVLGSVHFLGEFGLDVREMDHYYAEWGQELVWRRYYETTIAAVESDLFDVITHPDLPKLFGHPKPPLEFLDPWYRRLADALNAHQVALEINTAGLRRPIEEIYPALRLLEWAHQAEVSITIGSDAHEPENVGIFFPEALLLAKRAGYRSALGFKHGERQSLPFE